jgi:hypothetical protein
LDELVKAVAAILRSSSHFFRLRKNNKGSNRLLALRAHRFASELLFKAISNIHAWRASNQRQSLSGSH